MKSDVNGILGAVVSVLEYIAIEDAETALKDGNMYVDYSVYAGNPSYNNYNSWNTNQYINRFVLGNPGEVKEYLTYKEVQTVCGLINYDN